MFVSKCDDNKLKSVNEWDSKCCSLTQVRVGGQRVINVSVRVGWCTSELVVLLVVGQNFTDGLRGTDSNPGVEKHWPLRPTRGHLKPRAFGLRGHPQQLYQMTWANIYLRLCSHSAVWTGSDKHHCRAHSNPWHTFRQTDGGVYYERTNNLCHKI